MEETGRLLVGRVVEHVLSTGHQGAWHCEKEGSNGSVCQSYSRRMEVVLSIRKWAQSGRDWRMPQTKGDGCVLLDPARTCPPTTQKAEASLVCVVTLKPLVLRSPEMFVSPSGV